MVTAIFIIKKLTKVKVEHVVR